ncbi:MAG: imidazoleglycerol-phosphate dehydratase HisB [Syntrophales bacterium]|jgi:imidazoleglycerol-phosphate dehydratase|nr:imidazoleglycerol-phosphate dehydratase HisB [Syntrophales bacterium]MCK9527682.1 imidazoleglycerol-phosphate dehydratase HisB [Syntrophales bacterium]MDX9921663.1 imidazoleglycerol-phosphate dehydratase HisB [Syntrophales bacterium]
MERIAVVARNTTETDVSVEINLDGEGAAVIDTTLPFLDHMLVLLARHSLIDISVTGRGDTPVDDHHLVEDIGLCLGEALKTALGDKTGIGRYGTAFIPMDESLGHVSIDLSGRPCLVYNVEFEHEKIKDFDLLHVREFFKALADEGGITLHINAIYGRNPHHIAEALFKSFARALGVAVSIDSRIKGVLSTKGSL